MKYTDLAIRTPQELLFGTAPNPLTTRRGMVIGGGKVYPELNFTLPPMTINAETMPAIRDHYKQIIEGALLRAAELDSEGVVIEFETLPPMTEHFEWGLDIAKILMEGMDRAWDKYKLPTVFRMTPNDNREFVRPPEMRSGYYWDNMVQLFEGATAAGAELLSIESVGGKELHDDALLNGDIGAVIFSLCSLGVRDMRFLWGAMHKIASKNGAVCAGDTACGFGNTAMVLAEQKMIPRTFAAIVRAVTAVRSLVAYEEGAVGPGKDCGYENPILKAITGFPMAMEGKSAACAHLSPVGNIAAATCDTWSNESVQNIKLLGGMAPTCYMEQLIYDCRLMNEAGKDGPDAVRQLQKWLVNSDASLDPQALVLAPTSVIRIAEAIVKSPNHYAAGKAAAVEAVHILREAYEGGALKIPEREVSWFDVVEDAVADLPENEGDFIGEQLAFADAAKFSQSQYGL